MIESFVCAETEKIWRRQHSRRLPHDIQRMARRKLLILDAAPDLNSLRVPPGNRLEALKGRRSGQYSIRINDQWRIIFNWQSNYAENVQISDYHE